MLILPFGSTLIDYNYSGDFFHCSWIWRINLDSGEFGMGPSGYVWDLFIETPFKLIYKLLLSPVTRQVNKDLWLKDAESFEFDDSTNIASSKRCFVLYASVTLVQALIRRFLVQRRMFEPGVGKLYLEAKKRFESVA